MECAGNAPDPAGFYRTSLFWDAFFDESESSFYLKNLEKNW
jgi:hypothetical protein